MVYTLNYVFAALVHRCMGLIMVMCVIASLDGSSFVVLTVATIPADPSESPFGYPAFGQYDESFYVHGSQYGM